MRSRAFLHFHEDHGAMFADARTAGQGAFERRRVDTAEGAAELISAVETWLSRP
jgi:hypothetical protein